MPNFVWSVTDNSGRQAIREVVAENADESRRILVAQGCTDLIEECKIELGKK